jgi:hypothetical protein
MKTGDPFVMMMYSYRMTSTPQLPGRRHRSQSKHRPSSCEGPACTNMCKDMSGAARLHIHIPFPPLTDAESLAALS